MPTRHRCKWGGRHGYSLGSNAAFHHLGTRLSTSGFRNHEALHGGIDEGGQALNDVRAKAARTHVGSPTGATAADWKSKVEPTVFDSGSSVRTLVRVEAKKARDEE